MSGSRVQHGGAEHADADDGGAERDAHHGDTKVLSFARSVMLLYVPYVDSNVRFDLGYCCA
jgi:hypothetical protein